MDSKKGSLQVKKPVNYDKLKNINIAYIGGGSVNWAYNFMHDLACNGVIEGTVRLFDIDKQAAKRNEKYGSLVSNHPDAKSKWIYKSVLTLEEALTGADFVIISILPGSFREMEIDVHLPEKYGILQPVGDTVGPGGIMRALRCISAYRTFADGIKKYSPDAWVINYTNPMAICLRTLYTVFPGIKAFGCCHEVFGTQKLFARVAELHLGIKEIPREEIITNVLGINHFTWIDKASYKTLDLFPVYRVFSEKYLESGYEGLAPWKESIFNSANMVKFDLFLKYGIAAAAGDR
ncbi:MAG: alpha-glucosidase/alpha-galactosidase, partial [Spirochaetaceae bacterium]